MSQPVEILLIAGEASADMHAAHLVREVRELVPGARFFGVGGKRLADEGMEILVPAERLNVVGGSDWFDKIADVYRAYREVKKAATDRKPALAILLDLPDFNLKLARHLKKQGIKVVYYISPQVWAWRRYRVRTIARNVDKMLVVFPFEKKFYDAQGVDASFVGHPVLEHIQKRSAYRTQAEVREAPRVAVLPGSRSSELRYHADLLRAFGARLLERYPKAQLHVPVASTLDAEHVKQMLPEPFWVFETDSRKTICWADVAVVASGTATLETALLGTPFCLFYRLSPSTAWIVRHLIRYRRFFGMPNLLHGREVVREFLGDAATPEALLRECQWMIENERYRAGLADDLAICWELLGDPGASERAAKEVAAVLRSRPQREATLVHSPA